MGGRVSSSVSGVECREPLFRTPARQAPAHSVPLGRRPCVYGLRGRWTAVIPPGILRLMRIPSDISRRAALALLLPCLALAACAGESRRAVASAPASLLVAPDTLL